jgi:hypothetical protein
MPARWTRATAKSRRHALALAVAILLFASISCGGGTSVAPTGSGGVSVSPQPLTIAQGATMTFTCTSSITSSAPCDWAVEGDATVNVGSPLALSGSNTFRYTAPATPPIYTTPYASQGVVTVQAYYGYAFTTFSFAITAPSVTVGILNPVSSVALGSTATLNGYAVGNVNTGITWQVNGVTGGSTATGTILTPYSSATATYYAPSAIPITGSSVTITAVSQAEPTKTASTVITLH